MHVTPIYLQASACQLGYAAADRRYDEKRAQKYVAEIAERLRKVDAPPLQSFLGIRFPEPVAEAKKLGIIDDWRWVSDVARDETGVPAAPTPLLQKSVSNYVGDSALKGDMFLAWLHAASKELHLSGVDSARFTIIDHNAAHHLSAPMVKHAFTSQGRGGAKRVLVNFDFHSDADAAVNKGRESIARCDNWAGFMTQPVEHIYETAVVDVYTTFGVSLGLDKKESGNLGAGRFQRSDDRRAPQLIYEAAKWNKDPRSVTEQLAWVVHDVFAENDPIDVYVSVDRDFMKESYTPWGDGSQDPKAGREAVRQALAFFAERRAKLVGFDVVGLPALGGRSNVPMSEQGYLDVAYLDLTDMFQAVRDYPNP